MNIRGILLSLVAAGAMQLSATAIVRADQGSVVSGCGGGGNCSQLVTAYFADLKSGGASDAEINEAARSLTSALGELALDTNSSANRRNIAGGIRSAAAAAPALRVQLERIALAVEDEGGVATAASGT